MCACPKLNPTAGELLCCFQFYVSLPPGPTEQQMHAVLLGGAGLRVVPKAELLVTALPLLTFGAPRARITVRIVTGGMRCWRLGMAAVGSCFFKNVFLDFRE